MSKRNKKWQDDGPRLTDLIAAHARARAELSRLIGEAGPLMKIPKALDKALSRAHVVHTAAYSNLCRHRPTKAADLLTWLDSVLHDDLIRDGSIRVLDGVSAYTGATRCLIALLIPASIHER